MMNFLEVNVPQDCELRMIVNSPKVIQPRTIRLELRVRGIQSVVAQEITLECAELAAEPQILAQSLVDEMERMLRSCDPLAARRTVSDLTPKRLTAQPDDKPHTERF